MKDIFCHKKEEEKDNNGSENLLFNGVCSSECLTSPKNRKHAFTLAEMMVVMLVLSIVLAASMPLITKKANFDNSNIWKYSPTDKTHVYYGLSQGNGAMIGTKNPLPNSGDTEKSYNSMLYINIPNMTTSEKFPHMAFGVNGIPKGLMYFTNDQGLVIGTAVNNPGSGAIGIGRANATGTNSISIGYNNDKLTTTSTEYTGATGNYSIAIGQRDSSSLGPRAYADYSIAMGTAANALSKGAVVIGHSASASAPTNASAGVTIGQYAVVYSTDGIAIGSYAKACDSDSLGNYKNRSGAIAIGAGSQARGNYSIAIGPSQSNGPPIASGEYSIAIGSASHAFKSYSTAIGYKAHVGENETNDDNGKYSTAIGYNANTTVYNQIKIGDGVKRGSTNQTVYIPGKLYLGSGLGAKMLRIQSDGDYVRAAGGIAGGWYYLSDKRLKNVIEDYKSSLESIRELKIYRYNFKENEMVEKYKKELMQDKDNPSCPDKRPAQFKKCVEQRAEQYRKQARKEGTFTEEHVGVMAQDLEKVFPASVKRDSNGYLKIDKNEMFFTMINAIKELDAKLEKAVENIDLSKHDSFLKQNYVTREEYGKKMDIIKMHLYVLKNDIADMRKYFNKKIDVTEKSLYDKLNGVEKSLYQKIENVEKSVYEKIKNIEKNYVKTEDFKKEIANIQQKLDFLRNKLKFTDKELYYLRRDVASIKKELTRVSESALRTRDGYGELLKRISNLEYENAVLRKRLDALEKKAK